MLKNRHSASHVRVILHNIQKTFSNFKVDLAAETVLFLSPHSKPVGQDYGDGGGRRDHRAASQVGLVASAALHHVHGCPRKVQD